MSQAQAEKKIHLKEDKRLENEKRIQELKTRGDESKFRIRAASSFVIGYMLFILGAMVLSGLSLFMPMQGTVSDVKDIIVTISAIFSGPLGLMIGYFYRADSK